MSPLQVPKFTTHSDFTNDPYVFLRETRHSAQAPLRSIQAVTATFVQIVEEGEFTPDQVAKLRFVAKTLAGSFGKLTSLMDGVDEFLSKHSTSS